MHDEALLSADEIYALYQTDIDETLLYALEEGDRHEVFVAVNETWLLADMLAEVHVGHLNIAEALIEMQGKPLSTAQLLSEVELDANVSQSMRVISLNHALANDERFDRINLGREHAGFCGGWSRPRFRTPHRCCVTGLLRTTALC